MANPWRDREESRKRGGGDNRAGKKGFPSAAWLLFLPLTRRKKRGKEKKRRKKKEKGRKEKGHHLPPAPAGRELKYSLSSPFLSRP